MKKNIAICFHLYYLNLFKEFTDYIDNVIEYDNTTDLYITYQCSEEDLIPIKEKYPQAIYFYTPLGCDTGAFLYCADYFYKNDLLYHYILKIHTKKNVGWRIGMLNPIALNPEIVKKVIKKFEHHRNYGMIGSCRFKHTYIGSNKYIINEICQSMKIRYNMNHKFHFLAGTIFWIRGRILHKFCKRSLKNNIEPIQYYNQCEPKYPHEPSYTHSWERMIAYMTKYFGYKIKWIE